MPVSRLVPLSLARGNGPHDLILTESQFQILQEIQLIAIISNSKYQMMPAPEVAFYHLLCNHIKQQPGGF